MRRALHRRILQEHAQIPDTRVIGLERLYQRVFIASSYRVASSLEQARDVTMQQLPGSLTVAAIADFISAPQK